MTPLAPSTAEPLAVGDVHFLDDSVVWRAERAGLDAGALLKTMESLAPRWLRDFVGPDAAAVPVVDALGVVLAPHGQRQGGTRLAPRRDLDARPLPAPHRVERVARAARVILAAGRQRRGDEAAVRAPGLPRPRARLLHLPARPGAAGTRPRARAQRGRRGGRPRRRAAGGRELLVPGRGRGGRASSGRGSATGGR